MSVAARIRTWSFSKYLFSFIRVPVHIFLFEVFDCWNTPDSKCTAHLLKSRGYPGGDWTPLAVANWCKKLLNGWILWIWELNALFHSRCRTMKIPSLSRLGSLVQTIGQPVSAFLLFYFVWKIPRVICKSSNQKLNIQNQYNLYERCIKCIYKRKIQNIVLRLPQQK